MLSVIILVSLLLLILAAGSSTVQQDPLCTDSYAEFESASVGSNDSGRDIRNQLYKTFYALSLSLINWSLPMEQESTSPVIQTAAVNCGHGSGVPSRRHYTSITFFNLSSDPNCSSEQAQINVAWDLLYM